MLPNLSSWPIEPEPINKVLYGKHRSDIRLADDSSARHRHDNIANERTSNRQSIGSQRLPSLPASQQLTAGSARSSFSRIPRYQGLTSQPNQHAGSFSKNMKPVVTSQPVVTTQEQPQRPIVLKKLVRKSRLPTLDVAQPQVAGEPRNIKSGKEMIRAAKSPQSNMKRVSPCVSPTASKPKMMPSQYSRKTSSPRTSQVSYDQQSVMTSVPQKKTRSPRGSQDSCDESRQMRTSLMSYKKTRSPQSSPPCDQAKVRTSSVSDKKTHSPRGSQASCDQPKKMSSPVSSTKARSPRSSQTSCEQTNVTTYKKTPSPRASQVVSSSMSYKKTCSPRASQEFSAQPKVMSSSMSYKKTRSPRGSTISCGQPTVKTPPMSNKNTRSPQGPHSSGDQTKMMTSSSYNKRTISSRTSQASCEELKMTYPVSYRKTRSPPGSQVPCDQQKVMTSSQASKKISCSKVSQASSDQRVTTSPQGNKKQTKSPRDFHGAGDEAKVMMTSSQYAKKTQSPRSSHENCFKPAETSSFSSITPKIKTPLFSPRQVSQMKRVSPRVSQEAVNEHKRSIARIHSDRSQRVSPRAVQDMDCAAQNSSNRKMKASSQEIVNQHVSSNALSTIKSAQSLVTRPKMSRPTTPQAVSCEQEINVPYKPTPPCTPAPARVARRHSSKQRKTPSPTLTMRPKTPSPEILKSDDCKPHNAPIKALSSQMDSPQVQQKQQQISKSKKELRKGDSQSFEPTPSDDQGAETKSEEDGQTISQQVEI